jgi:sigma-B regulation protein RsbU (phosphoserine phosphatase)
MNADDEEWGEERMMQAVTSCCSLPAASMMEELMGAADAFVAGAPQHDDMTVMIVKVLS